MNPDYIVPKPTTLIDPNSDGEVPSRMIKTKTDAYEARKMFYEQAEKDGLTGEVGKPSAAKYNHYHTPITPSHYTSTTNLEVIDIIDAFNLNAYEANIIKYVLRYSRKDGITDLKKAAWYLDRLIKKQEKIEASVDDKRNS